ncbi:MAG: MGMT family protein [Candidatus Paceibacterota bacterium]|nr:MAG: MGMT family protein [Candidatus Paceibacterota bacterium]
MRPVAQKIGNPQAVRAVGSALNKNTNKEIPCHRVIRSDGSLGGYNKGARAKEALFTQRRSNYQNRTSTTAPRIMR